jgi:Fic family protein
MEGERQENIILGLKWGNSYALSEIMELLKVTGAAPSNATLRRDLSALTQAGFLAVSGARKTARYSLTIQGLLFAPVKPKDYCSLDPDLRDGNKSFNFKLFDLVQNSFFSENELNSLEAATKNFHKSAEGASEVIRNKELERFIIELSWKSSKIEGNTYSLLDTEKLIRDGIEAEGHSKEEAIMILNHKTAFQYILELVKNYQNINLFEVTSIHQLLTKDLDISSGFRNKMVGITGSIYKPIELSTQLKEAMDSLLRAVSRLKDPYSKALLTLIGIAYIQPYEDGNKRTSRLTANAVLLGHQCAPLSYRSIDETYYKESVLVFYEKNSLTAIKQIFIEQYIFSCENYLLSQQ